MELLCRLDLEHTNQFFGTFFKLPAYFWRGFLGSTLNSAQLLAFAGVTFAIAPVGIKAKLVSHLMTHPAGQYLLRAYLGVPPPSLVPLSTPCKQQFASFY